MALSIIPKSEIRQVTSITHGFGEIPTVNKDGVVGFALPGKHITFDRALAEHFLVRLDTTIRSNTIPPKPKPVQRTRIQTVPDATINYGAATIPLVTRKGSLCWLLPGGATTRSKREALFAARRMDTLIQHSRNKLKQASK